MSILKRIFSRKPNMIVGDYKSPYLLRWYLIPRNRWMNLYLHKFLKDDDDRALHDHPWWFVSWIISGFYLEFTDNDIRVRRRWSIAFRPAEHRHYVRLPRELYSDEIIPCWTIVLTGPNRRTWGFWCKSGFVPWYEFLGIDENGIGSDDA